MDDAELCKASTFKLAEAMSSIGNKKNSQNVYNIIFPCRNNGSEDGFRNENSREEIGLIFPSKSFKL
jgi:hypothetical protein